MAKLLTRRVKNVNPAGGVNPAQEPNVGQYGWTKADAAHVNQLITYVEECKKYAEQAKASAVYIGGSIKVINELYEKVKILYEKVVPLATNIEAIYNAVKTIGDDVTAKHDAIQRLYIEILDVADEIRTLHGETKVFHDASKINADNSWDSAIRSETAAQEARDIAEELRKGNVYRGTWNPHTGSYPAHGGTNSTWDVILNENEIEYEWNGIKWYWGDRLIYLKDGNLYQQVESGTTVVSVNGKKGAVVLSAGDVDAYSKAESDGKFVPKTTTINSKPLSANVVLEAGDVGAYTKMEIDNKNSQFVKQDRSINGYFLTTDITLKASDVKARPDTWFPTATETGAWPADKVNTNGNGWSNIINKVPYVNEVGVTELGAYVDMREEKSDADFSWRWWAGVSGAGKLTLQNGASAAVAEFGGDGKLHLPASGITCQNRIDVRAGQNPMIELHAVGQHAYAQYVTNSGDWRFVRTDGAGGESHYQFVSFNNGDLIVRGKYRADNHGNCGWADVEKGAFRVNAVINMTPQALTKVFSHRVEYPGNWTLDQSYGTYSEVSGRADEISHVFVSTDGGSYTKIWKLRNDGFLHSPSGSMIAPDGNIFGSVWGNRWLTDWAYASFAPISDGRLKDVIGPSTKSAVDVVNQFDFKQYRWKGKPEKGVIDIGLIAQEVEEVDPNLVRTIKTGDDETMALDTAGLLSVALKAIQELEARVRELEAKGDS